MAEKRHGDALDVAFAVFKTLWEQTDEDHHLSFSELEKAIGKESLDRRWVWEAIDAAQRNGISLKRPTKHSPRSEGYRFDGRPFENWEVGYLCDQIEVSRVLSPKEKASLVNKVLNLAPVHEQRTLRRRIACDSPRQMYKGDLADKIALLNSAITDGKKVEFTYYEYAGRGELKERPSSSHVPVEPYHFAFRDGNYYLLAARELDNDMAFRVYRVDRIADIVILNEFCTSSLSELSIDPNDILRKSFGMFLGGKSRKVELVFDAETEKYVLERFPDVGVEETDSASYSATVDVIPSPPFYAWIFQFGGKVQIAGPDDLVGSYKSMVSAAFSSPKAD